MARSWEDRVREYLDSPALRQRIRAGKTITCGIDGNYGAYTTVITLARGDMSTCTCPAEERPCKHIEALHRTYRANPASFLDLDALLDGLARRTKEEIIGIVRTMVIRAPEAVGGLGIEGAPERADDDHPQELEAPGL
jgi:uncharacterized Zn finger protein